MILSGIIAASERLTGEKGQCSVCGRRDPESSWPLFLSQREAEGTWLHSEMRLCVSVLGTGIRGGLCFEQPEPEAEGC